MPAVWPEVEEVASKKRCELRLVGKVLVQRLEEAPAGLDEIATACPTLTFLDLSAAGASLQALPANLNQLLQLHELKCIHNALRSVVVRRLDGAGGCRPCGLRCGAEMPPAVVRCVSSPCSWTHHHPVGAVCRQHANVCRSLPSGLGSLPLLRTIDLGA